MRFHQSGFEDAEARDGHVEGWRECIERFEVSAGHKELTR